MVDRPNADTLSSALVRIGFSRSQAEPLHGIETARETEIKTHTGDVGGQCVDVIGGLRFEDHPDSDDASRVDLVDCVGMVAPGEDRRGQEGFGRD